MSQPETPLPDPVPVVHGERAAALLADYRHTFGTGFRFFELWRDRRAILADPGITTRDQPPLANSPLRFALALGVVPVLAIGWLMSQLAAVTHPDATPQLGPMGQRAIVVEQRLADYTGTAALAEVKAIARRSKLSEMPEAARELDAVGRKRLALHDNAMTPVTVGHEAEGWLRQLAESPITDEERRVLAAKMQLRARGVARVDAVATSVMRSILEGGTAMQIVGALSLVLSAFLFRRLAARDPRFALAARADRLYLYYVTSRTFWFTLAVLACYGVISFASASGDLALLARANIVSQMLAVASLVYVLMGSAAMARSLHRDGELVPGAARSLGWRLLASQVLAMGVLILLGMLLGIAIGIGAAVYTIRF